MPAKISDLDRITQYFLLGDLSEVAVTYKVVQSIVKARNAGREPNKAPRRTSRRKAEGESRLALGDEEQS